MFHSELHAFVEGRTRCAVQLRTADQRRITVPGDHAVSAGNAVALQADLKLRPLTAQETAALDDLSLGYLEGQEALRDMRLEASLS